MSTTEGYRVHVALAWRNERANTVARFPSDDACSHRRRHAISVYG